MRPCRIAAAAILAAAVLDATATRAEPTPSIEVHAPDGCSAAAHGLPERVRAALVGEPAADLQASVTIEQHEGRHEAIVRTARGATELGVKLVSAPTCEEAVDAAVVVLAMALAKQPRGDGSAPVEPAGGVVEPAGVPVEPAGAPAETPRASPASAPAPRSPEPSSNWVPAWQPTADHPNPDRASTARERHTRVSVLGGLDVGTTPLATLYVGARVSREVGPVELRGTARYGLPRVDEENDAGVVDERQTDFGSFDADVCYARGRAWQVAMCGGGEVGVVRNVRRSGAEGSLEDTDEARPRLAGIMAARLAYRAGMLQPELEVAGAAAAIGRPENGSWFAIRAGFGLAVQF